MTGFVNCNGPTGARIAAPTVDISPAGVPVPSVNVSNTVTSVPVQTRTFFQCTPGQTILSAPPVSVGDVGQPVTGSPPMSRSQNVSCTIGTVLSMQPQTTQCQVVISDCPPASGVGMQAGPSQFTTINLKPM